MGMRDAFGREVNEVEPFDDHFEWRGGAGAGLLAAVAMGVAMTVVEPGLLRDAIAGLYGQSGSLAVGWAAHLFHGVVFGLVFAVLLDDPSLVRVSDSLGRSVGLGVAYGVVLGVVGMGIVMPMWLDALGLSLAPDVPFASASLLGWHVLFGAVLGLLFPYLEGL